MSQEKTRAIRISLDTYATLCELGKKNETFASLLERIFRENNIIAMVTENENNDNK
jgi:predicted CopG family antitoxin